MKERQTLKERLSRKSEKEIFALLLFFSCIIIMTVLAIFRFCGIGYFANEYREHTLIPWVQELILFSLKLLELFFILAILSTIKLRFVAIISFLYANIYWFVNNESLSLIIDIIYYTIVSFIIEKLDYKRITYGLILMLVLSAYQFIIMFARYTIDITAKFNYMAGIASVFDYKIFIVSIYLLIYNRRLKMKRIDTPNPEAIENYGGGHCTLFFGVFEKVCEIIGKVVVSICTLGILPLVVYECRKNNKEKDKAQDDNKVAE